MSDQVVVELLVAAPPSKVFQFLTDSEKWARWQGEEATIDARPGGIFKMRMGNGMTARGQFVNIDQDARVEFTWGWVDNPGIPPGSSSVVIDLIRQDDGTMIRLVHTGLTTDEIPLHNAGWDHYLPRLAAVAVGQEVGPDNGPGG